MGGVLTTTAQNSCDAEVWIDNSAGTPKNVSGSSTSVQHSASSEIGEFKTFANRWKVRLACGQDLPLKISIVYSTAADEGWAILKEWFFTSRSAARTVTTYMPTKNVGSDVIEGEFLLQDMEWTLDSAEAGPVVVSASLIPTGEVTLSVVST